MFGKTSKTFKFSAPARLVRSYMNYHEAEDRRLTSQTLEYENGLIIVVAFQNDGNFTITANKPLKIEPILGKIKA